MKEMKQEKLQTEQSGVGMVTKTNRLCDKKVQKNYNLKSCLYTLKYTPKSIRAPENQRKNPYSESF